MVTTLEMMKARENRVQIQNEMLKKYGLPIVYFSMNIPGPEKTNDLFRYAFQKGKELLLAQIQLENIEIVYQNTLLAATGDEFFCVCHSDCLTLKQIGVFVEETEFIGRIFDIDIINTDGLKVERSSIGQGERKCFICENPAVLCARSRAHSLEEMLSNITNRIESYKKKDFVQDTLAKAIQALLYEVSITPKPGLVDRNDNGAHKDMDFFRFMDSTASLTYPLQQFIVLGLDSSEITSDTLWQLKGIGKEAERKMRLATGGINTHKGAIFSLGLFLFSLGYCYPEKSIESLRNTLLALSKLYDLKNPMIAKEVANGYPSVFEIGLPIYKECLNRKLSQDEAGVKTLLYILANCQDSNIIKRSNAKVANSIKEKLKKTLETRTDYLTIAKQFNEEFISENISAGGSADLLMLSIFCYLTFR